MAENMSVDDEPRAKLQKVFDGFISDQEERQLNKWIEQTCQKEMKRAIFETNNRIYYGEDSSILEVGNMIHSMFDTQDDCRNETAFSFKMQGNRYFQLKHYRSAILAYNAGILLQPSDQELLALLYNNISSGLVHIKNYGTALSHCENALEIKASYEKVLSRKALCLQKLRESYDAADSNTKMKVLCHLNHVCASRTGIHSREMTNTEKRVHNNLLMKTICQRNYRFDTDNVDLANLIPIRDQLKDHRVSLIDGRLVWPTYIVFPDFGRIYFIQQFGENESFQDVICDFLALSSDCCKYLPEFLQVYFVRGEYIFRFGMRKTLEEILSLKSYVIKHGTPQFIALVKGGKQEVVFLEQCDLVNLNE